MSASSGHGRLDPLPLNTTNAAFYMCSSFCEYDRSAVENFSSKNKGSVDAD